MITLRGQAAIAAGILASAMLVGTAGAESHLAPHFSPGAEALRVELTLQHDRGSLERNFYEARGYLPVWLADDGAATPAARALLSWASEADSNGLPVARYGVSALAARLAKASSGAYSSAAALEAELTQLFLTYGRDISSGLLEPRRLGRSFDLEPRRPNPATLLAGIGTTGDIPAFLDGLTPADPAYDRLLTLYAGMREIAGNGDWGQQIAKGRTLHPGDGSPRVEQLRARLIALGDMAPAEQVAAGAVIARTGQG